jgi:hypothetical protein
MTRFQLVFRENGKHDHSETRDDNQHDEPHINGKLILDGEMYTIRGVDWIVRRDGRNSDEVMRFICTLAVTPQDDSPKAASDKPRSIRITAGTDAPEPA